MAVAATRRSVEGRAVRAGLAVFCIVAPLMFFWTLAREPITVRSLLEASLATFILAGMASAAVTTTMLLTASLRDDPVRRATRCAHCDYDLTGAPGDRCPECGASTHEPDPTMLWKS